MHRPLQREHPTHETQGRGWAGRLVTFKRISNKQIFWSQVASITGQKRESTQRTKHRGRDEQDALTHQLFLKEAQFEVHSMIFIRNAQRTKHRGRDEQDASTHQLFLKEVHSKVHYTHSSNKKKRTAHQKQGQGWTGRLGASAPPWKGQQRPSMLPPVCYQCWNCLLI
jgi:hypothetical protein